MSGCRIEGISEVHEKRGTLPAQAYLDEGVCHVCSVQEVGGCNSNGVRRPTLKDLFVRDLVDLFCGNSEVLLDQGVCDETTLPLVAVDSYRLTRRHLEAESAVIDAPGR